MTEESTNTETHCGYCAGQHPYKDCPVIARIESEAEAAALAASELARRELRDRFAMAALAASMNYGGNDPVKWAENAYRIADAMFAARAK